MHRSVEVEPDLVAKFRRDIAQIQLLADMDALSPDDLRRLLASLGDLVNSVELLGQVLRDQLVGAPTEKVSVFEGLKARLGVTPDRMRTVGGLGVIDGGLA